MNFIQEIADHIATKSAYCKKEMLTTAEAAAYMGVSKSYIYKLTMEKRIPFYKPLGKMCYFKRQELESWLLNNRVATNDEMSQRAQSYCMMKGGDK